MKHCCSDLEFHLREGEVAVVWIPKFREYGIKVLDGGSSLQIIKYCPWCGTPLPSSLRDEWFNRLEKMGMEPEDDIPVVYQTDAWWNSGGS